MKSIRFFLTMVLLKGNIQMFSQTNIKIEKSEKYDEMHKQIKISIGEIDDNYYFVEHDDKNGYDEICMYNGNLKKIKSEPITSDNKDKLIVKPIILNNSIHMLSYLSDKKSNSTIFTLDAIDPKSLKSTGKSVPLFKEGFMKITMEIYGQLLPDTWYFSVSPDSSKFSLSLSYKDKLYVSVLNKDYTNDWNNEIVIPDWPNFNCFIRDVDLLNSGDLTFLVAKYDGPHTANKINYMLGCVTAKGKSVKYSTYKHEEPYFDCKVFISKENVPYLTGMFRNIISYKPLGIFFNPINMKTASVEKREYKFKNSIFPEVLSDKARKGATDADFKKNALTKRLLNNLEIHETSDHSFFIIIEQYNNTNRDNIYVAFISGDKLKWDVVLPRKTLAFNINYLQVNSGIIGKQLYIYYNNCIENLNKETDSELEEMKNFQSCDIQLFQAEFDKAGLKSRKLFSENEKIKTYSLMRFSDQKNVLIFKAEEETGEKPNKYKVIEKDLLIKISGN